MKKIKLKSLSLSKTSISKLNSENILGGALDSSKSFRLEDCPVHVTEGQTCQYSCNGSCYC